MAIDMEQFKATYIEESLEGLDDMETNLLTLQPGSDDMDAINTIFRAAHSIKGGGATFGFSQIAEFTHVVETLLDEIRNGERKITQDAIELFLESVDCLRALMADTDSGDTSRVDELKKSLEIMLGLSSKGDSKEVEKQDKPQSNTIAGWNIRFRPFENMLKTGNDVVRMFRELEELGEMLVEVDTSALPTYEELEPEFCYLAWRIELTGDIRREQIEEIFSWVEDECELDIVEMKSADVSTSLESLSSLTAVEEAHANSSPNDDKSLARNVVSEINKGADDRREGEDRRRTDRRNAGPAESSSIRVAIEKIDDMINMVGELVITQSMLSQLGEVELEEFNLARLEKIREGLGQLERNTRELQESVMRIRMLPISFTFNRFPRMVHDMCVKLDKKIELKVTGEGTELDKTVMEKIGDPLVHIIRNSCDHGIEKPEVRVAAGKPETGTVHLEAFHQGGDIVIQIRDDGAGLNKSRILAKAKQNGLVDEGGTLSDEQIYDLLFRPGFSTAEKITDVSGRGVGMDVVRKNIQALGGRVEVSSVDGVGSTFTIRLPLTLAILDGQLVKVGRECYVIPLVSIVESMQLKSGMVRKLAGKAELYRLRNEYLPIVRLYETFDVRSEKTELTEGLIVVVEGGDGRKSGLFVDDLLSQQQVVIKSLETNFRSVEGVSGATILGDGTVALIVDVPSLIGLAHNKLKPGELQKIASQNKAA